MEKKYALTLKNWKEFENIFNFSEVIEVLYSRGFEIIPAKILKELKEFIPKPI